MIMCSGLQYHGIVYLAGNHMYLNAVVDGERVTRPYTPVTSDDELGYFELVIKVREKYSCTCSYEAL